MPKRSPYRLQIVLDQKGKARDEAAKYLAQCRENLAKEEKEAKRLAEELSNNRRQRQGEAVKLTQSGANGQLDANGAQLRLNFIKKLDMDSEVLEIRIDRQKEKVEEAKVEVERALKDLIQASRELKVMEKHKEKWLDKIKKEEEKRDQRQMNEIGNMMYNANQ